MLKSLKIENFRGFKAFELKQLGRINLLVGENNNGKTSVLESLLLLLSRLDLEPISQAMQFRGEVLTEVVNRATEQKWLDIMYLFYGRNVGFGSQLMIEGRYDTSIEKLTLDVEELTLDEIPGTWDDQVGMFDEPVGALKIEWSSQKLFHDELLESQTRLFELQPNKELLLKTTKRSRQEANYPLVKTHLIPAESVYIAEMLKLFEDIQLTPDEEILYDALHIIEPKCKRIAGKPSHNRFEVKLSDQEQPIPLGSMGDGMSRILRLALGLTHAKGGVLLVDEIDTGLHFMAMTGMWKMLWEASNQLDVQIFATTHSRDCWESLAEVAELVGVQDEEIMIHRIEKGKQSSVTFNPTQMAIAAERGIEVR